MMRMWQGAVGVVPLDGFVSPAYVVARPYPEVDARYFACLFRTVNHMREVEIYSRGIVPDRTGCIGSRSSKFFHRCRPSTSNG
jgi:type I restriction enzyme S subunit